MAQSTDWMPCAADRLPAASRPRSMPPATILCLTPVRNEAWILECFLRCASQWADQILVLDQASEDGSAEIAARFPKVRLLRNSSRAFDEPGRQRRLIAAAREVPGPRLLVALDADEILAASTLTGAGWRSLRDLAPGTVVLGSWMNLRPGLASAWEEGPPRPLAVLDDGSEHHGLDIHSPRLPLPDGAPRIHAPEMVVLHYQYTAWDRMLAKQRWYQCLERLLHPDHHPIAVYRLYHHMHAVPAAQERQVRREWIAPYERQGIDLRPAAPPGPFWFDREILDLIERHGAPAFARQAIWDETDWRGLAARLGRGQTQRFADPRSTAQRLVQLWLERTQPRHRSRPIARVDAWLERAEWTRR